MVSHTLILTKVIGTVSLGALAGTIVSTTQIAIPLLLVPQTAADAKNAVVTLYKQSAKMLVPLAATSFVALSVSFVGAAAAGRHPYLVYAALSVPAVAAIGYFRVMPVVGAILGKLTAAPQATASGAKKAESEMSTPVTQDTTPALSEEEEEEHSALDNSVYRTVDKTDYEDVYGSASGSIDKQNVLTPHVPMHVPEPVAPTPPPALPLPIAEHGVVSKEVPALVEQLVHFGNIAGAVSGLAFVLATVGIYGDIASWAFYGRDNDNLCKAKQSKKSNENVHIYNKKKNPEYKMCITSTLIIKKTRITVNWKETLDSVEIKWKIWALV